MRTIIALCLLSIHFFAFNQITEIESKLRTKPVDTIVGWKKNGNFAFNLAQTSLTNWASGGQNSIAINTLFNYTINYKNKTSSWDNSFDIGYGILRQGEVKTFTKTDDKIDILSKYGRKAMKNLFYAAALNFKTQMAPGFSADNDSVRISNFMAPAYIIGSIGMDYKPAKSLSFFVAPFTSKTTIVNDQELANKGFFGVTPAVYDTNGVVLENGSKIRSEFGGYIRMIYTKNDFKKEYLQNIGITTKLDLFSNYLKNPQNIDVNWETLITMKINKYIALSISTHLYYDDDIVIAVDKNKDGVIDARGPRLQFKQILGVGLSYKF
jgi:hypothetical protein